MKMINTATHKIGHILNRRSGALFLKQSKKMKDVQSALQSQWLHKAKASDLWPHRDLSSWENFRVTQPVTDYTSWQTQILRQKKQNQSLFAEDCQRFEPTSGSTSRRKWTPYPQSFLQDLNKAAGPWLADIGERHPGTLKGRHYWSLSWLPEDLRKQTNNNDLELLSKSKRFLMGQIMACPDGLQNLSTSLEARQATAISLARCEDLSLISVWSPSFLFSILEDMHRYRDLILEILSQKEWVSSKGVSFSFPSSESRIAKLEHALATPLHAQSLKMLWPHLKMISCWDSGSSSTFAEDLRKLFPDVFLQGKGLWATEGVVTIPFQGRYPLAFQSHVYEFQCLESQKILYPWELETGQVVSPILSTSSGLARYKLQDALEVQSFLNDVPCLKFMSRLHSVDLTGEKMDAANVDRFFKQISSSDVSGVAMVGLKIPKPHYQLFIQGPSSLESEIHKKARAYFARDHHYRLSRELNQLGPLKINMSPRALSDYHELRETKTPLGNIKVEPLVEL